MHNRNRMIAGNWKMNKTYAEGVELAQDLSDTLKEMNVENVDVVVCPPMVDLKGVEGVIEFEKAPFMLGAQNCFYEESGAYTGETSCEMLKALGVEYCLIGHSERREYFHETDEDINLKAKALMSKDIKPLVCCGEPLEIREAGTHVEFVVNQIKAALNGLKLTNGNDLVIAYEPIWAIGTGMTATPEDAQEVNSAIRVCVAEMFGAEVADAMRILYGGSANPANVQGFLNMEDVDGALVGGASLKADAFSAMIEKAAE